MIAIRFDVREMFVTPASLLYRLRQPDQVAAWGYFVDLYSPLLLNWSHQLGLQESDRDDLVQDVFLILWNKLPEFEYDPNKSFHAWLKTIFLNRYRSKLRQQKPQPACLDDFESSQAEANMLDEEDDTQYLIRQIYRLVERELSPIHQQIFRMYVIQQQLPDVVAQSLGVQVSTVYSAKSKILSRLRAELKQLLD